MTFLILINQGSSAFDSCPSPRLVCSNNNRMNQTDSASFLYIKSAKNSAIKEN